MSTVIHLLWATIERALPRVASAVILLAFATFTNPDAVGIYSWVALSYTLYLAIVENVLRNQAIMGIGNARDMEYVRRLSRRASWAGSLFLVLTLGILWLVYRSAMAQEILLLTPFVAVPFISRTGITAVATMQYAQRWRELARFQLWAALGGLAGSFTTVMVTHSALGMSVHVVITESVFAALALRSARTVAVPTDLPTRNPQSETPSLSLLGGLGWSQGQLERVVIGGLAGISTLGLYSTASTMGRSPGEALATATANYLRASVSGLPEEKSHAAVVRRVGLISVAAASSAAFMAVILVDFIFDPLLGPSWAATLHAVPLLAVATIPYAASLGLQTMSVYYQNPRASIVPAVLALACAFPIGWLALTSLTAAAMMVIVKELMVLIVCALMARIPGSRETVVAACAATTVVGTLIRLFA